MRVAIHQPNLFPRLKVLQKIASSDCWVVLDNVQYVHREWQNRTRLLNYQNGIEFWLTIPCGRPNGRRTMILDVEVINIDDDKRRIDSVLRHAFRRSLYWGCIDEVRKSLIGRCHSNKLKDLAVLSTLLILENSGIYPNVVFASNLGIETETKSKYLASICKAVDASSYIADSGALSYLDTSCFGNIDVVWQDWKEPEVDFASVRKWRDISGLNYLAYAGPYRMRDHLMDLRL